MKELQAVNELLGMLNRRSCKVSNHEFLSDLFECGAIALSNRFDWKQAEKREKEYMRIISKYDADIRNLLSEMFGKIAALLTQQVNPHSPYGFYDYLGELYMRSETSNSKTGQFFTPYHLSKAIAKVSFCKEEIEEYNANNKILTLEEPACGGGGMVLAAADVLYNECDFNISHNLFVSCSDIDARCVHMAYLQLGLAGIPAVIYHMDTLTLQTWGYWITPACIMQWCRFERFFERNRKYESKN